MALDTFSKFYYGFSITSSNQNFNFSEGGGELTAQLEIGSFTMSEMTTTIKTALDAAGALTYTVTVDRATRKFTISATGTYEILLGTGSQISTSPFALLGFTQGVDLTSASTYDSASASGSEFRPQLIIQDYIDGENFQQILDPSVNESASGKVETLGFGTLKTYNMSFKIITDLAMDGHFIKNNSTGVSDARDFLEYITQKRPIEFMVDVDDSATFVKLLLDSTPSNNQGVGFRLSELTNKNVRDIYEINNLRFRAVE